MEFANTMVLVDPRLRTLMYPFHVLCGPFNMHEDTQDILQLLLLMSSMQYIRHIYAKIQSSFLRKILHI